MEKMKPQADLEKRTKAFALAIISLATKLPRSLAADVMAQQFLRSGTAIGANYREANRAESHADFIHKIAIIEREASETQFWLELMTRLVVPGKLVLPFNHDHPR